MLDRLYDNPSLPCYKSPSSTMARLAEGNRAATCVCLGTSAQHLQVSLPVPVQHHLVHLAAHPMAWGRTLHSVRNPNPKPLTPQPSPNTLAAKEAHPARWSARPPAHSPAPSTVWEILNPTKPPQ